jgi:hypothetical protein
MPLGMILRRMWRERRLLGVLLLAVCLVSGFFALGPLYVRGVSEAGIRYAVDNTAPEALNITLSNREPLGPDVWELLNQELGGVVTDITRIARSSSLTNGYRYTLGDPTDRFTGGTENDYLIVSYSNMDSLFEVVQGRWPVRLAPPTSGLVAGMNDEELAANQLGDYSRGEVEAVISTTAAETANIEVGNRVVVGAEPDGPTAVVNIVGLVEPALSLEDPFWEGQRVVVEGQWIPISLTEERYDFGLIVPEGAFEDWIAPTTDGNTFIWLLKTDSDVVHADTLDALEERLMTVQNTLRARYPNMLIFSGMINLIEDFREGLADTEGPIVLLSGAVLVLMLYHLVTTVALVLEQQSTEWASISSRGGSIAQLIGMQFFTMAVLGLIGFIVGPFISQGILLLLERVGPLARTLDGATLGLRSLPLNAYVLSGVAALAAVLVLTLPAWPAARRSLLRLKQLVSRPPTTPTWARYFLDFILLIVGFAFMLRLYFLISGDIGSSIQTLFTDPASLIRLIASGAADTGGLNDPFNLLGPALVLTGTALLWLRLFPLLMRLFSRLFASVSGLVTPLALWSVERDPGHYAQLVLLLIGTLALGTASLALEATRDVGAWAIAQDETGANVRLELDPAVTEGNLAVADLPDVEAEASLLVARTPHRAGQPDTVLIGVDPAAYSAAFPEAQDILDPLVDLNPPQLAGITLPEDATSLALDVYATVDDDDLLTETRLAANLIDAIGVPVTLDLTTLDFTDAGQFVPYSAALPTSGGQAPWRLVGFSLLSTRGELQDFTHTIYVDDIRAVTADGMETVLEDFEATAAIWEPSARHFQLPEDLVLAASEAQAVSGTQSLQVDYRIRHMGTNVLVPTLAVDQQPDAIVPLIISRTFADYYGTRAAQREPYDIGDEGVLDADFAHGGAQVRFRVVGIVDDFPTLGDRDTFALAWTDQLRPVLNASASLRGYYDWNQAWLMLAEREPSAAFVTAAAAVPGVTNTVYAWERYNEIQRDPLPNAITGMLFAGFWVSLILSILDFGFYLAVTARRRAVSFAVLQAIGWEATNVWRVLAVEQAALVIPALLVGVGLGAVLAYLLLPFLELIGGEALRFPVVNVAGLLAVLVVVFVGLLGATAVFLRQQSVNQVLRLGEE